MSDPTGTHVHQATPRIFTANQKWPRRVYVALGAVLAICVVLLGAVGGEVQPPQFKIGKKGLLKATEYPLWQQVSDWMAGRRYVLLTFDDGPYGNGIDERILAALAKNHAHAIFFEVCSHLDNDTDDVPREIVASGNILGNHSFSHLHLPRVHGSALNHQIAGCSNYLKAVSGIQPKYLRPPWGQSSPAVLKAIHSAGMKEVLWDANSGDTWMKDPEKIISFSIKEVSLSRASILLMHSRPTTAVALDELLTRLKQQNVRFILPVDKSG